ncbi:unnamed protein product [Linum tenue]
MEDSD